MADRRRLTALATGVVGVVTLAITLGFGQLPAVRAAGACVVPNAIIAFELATTPAELTRIFHPPGDPCRAPALAAMDQANHLDVFAYIPSYTLFAVLAVLFLAGRPTQPRALAALAAAAAAMVADYVETTTLLTITKDLGAGASLMARSSTAAWVKFGSLALHALLLGGICLLAAPRRLILGLLLFLPAPAYCWMILDPSKHTVLNLAFFASWTPLMLIALWEGVRGRRAATSAG